VSAIDGIEGGPIREIDPPNSVIELRTHGVSGTPPESMLNCSAVVQVWGDDTGRFFRAADTLGVERWQVTSLNAESDAPVSRYREGYHWGRMTSGGLRQALWALLIPFALVNLSQWMVPPAGAGALGRWAVTLLRALVRLVGLGLTLMLMVQLSVVIADMLAVQCLQKPECLVSWTLIDWLRHSPSWTALLVLLVIALPVFVASRITAQSREALLPDTAPPRPPAEGAEVPVHPDAAAAPKPNIAAPDFYRRGSAAPARTLHATVALAGAALLVCGGIQPLPSPVAKFTWGIAVLLIAIGAVFAALLDDPRSSGGRYSGGRLIAGWLGGDGWKRGLWWGAAAVNLAVAVLFSFRPMLTAEPAQWRPGLNDLVELLFVGLAGLCLIAFLVALLAARSSRAYFASVPRAFKPWLGGITTAVLLPLAALLGAGLGAGVAQTAQNCLTTGCKPQLLITQATPPDVVMPKAYDAIAMLWGITTVVVLALALIGGVAALCYLKVSGKDAPARLVQGKPMLIAWFFAGLKVQGARILLVVVLVAVFAGAVAAVVVDTHVARWVRGGGSRDGLFRATGLSWLAREEVSAAIQGIGILALALIVIGLLYAIYNAYRRPDSAGRSLGVLWDLASFWPTESHPLVPPCYARKAIDDLTLRVLWYREKYPQARIVLCGHSQGSLLMYATVLRLARLDAANLDPATHLLSRVGLVTHGSQLQWAYGRAFPDMLSYFSHQTVMQTLAGRWHNLIRFTDPLGGGVLSWNLRVEDGGVVGDWMPGGPETPTTFFTTTSKARVVGHERWLPDPVLNEPIFPARKHSDYTLDAQWDDVVALAAGI
jgi:hypothetical protein